MKTKREGKNVFLKKEAHEKLEIIKMIEQMTYEECLAKLIIERYEEKYQKIDKAIKEARTTL